RLAPRRGPARQGSFDQDRVRIPGNGRVVVDQPGLFVAEMQRLWLGPGTQHWPKFIHGPIVQTPDGAPHRDPPTRPRVPAPGTPGMPGNGQSGNGTVGTPRQTGPAPVSLSTRGW